MEGSNTMEWDWKISESWKVMTALNLFSLLKGQRKPDLEVWTQSLDSFSPTLFRRYINRSPRNLRPSRLFYLSIKYNSGPGDETWYKIQPMGENKINSMMKNIISQTTLRSSENRFTNHSACKTLVSKRKKADLERSSIAKVTDHNVSWTSVRRRGTYLNLLKFMISSKTS